MLALWKKSYDQTREHIKKQRHYFANKGPSCQDYVFFSSQYRFESWTEKRAECWRIDAFELCCWRRLLRVPWTPRRSNQSILKRSVLSVHWQEWCWSWNSNTLATCCKELTRWKRPWCWERLRAGGERDDRGWNGWMASLTQWTWAWVNSGSWWWTGWPGVLWSTGSGRVRLDWVTELNWTEYYPVWIYHILLISLCCFWMDRMFQSSWAYGGLWKSGISKGTVSKLSLLRVEMHDLYSAIYTSHSRLVRSY